MIVRVLDLSCEVQSRLIVCIACFLITDYGGFDKHQLSGSDQRN
jgi:hypothetical protein